MHAAPRTPQNEVDTPGSHLPLVSQQPLQLVLSHCCRGAPEQATTVTTAATAMMWRMARGYMCGRTTMQTVLLALLLAAVPCERVKPPLKRAECERKAGHFGQALELVDEWLAKKPRDKKAAKLREQLEQQLVHLEWFSEPEGAMVARDGEELGPTPLSLTLDPGRYVFRFTHEGYQPLEREETAVAGTRPKLTAVLEKLPAPVPEPVVEQAAAPQLIAPVPAPSPPPEKEHSNAPLILGSAGIFVAIGGGVLILTSLLAPASDQSAAMRQWVGYGLVGAGAAAGIAAIIWLLIDRRPGAAATAPAR